MYNRLLHKQLNETLQKEQIDIAGEDNLFFTRFIANATAIDALFHEIYGRNPGTDVFFNSLIGLIAKSYTTRPTAMIQRDEEKEMKGNWFLSNEIAGMSLYVDRFCGSIKNMEDQLSYFKKLGVNLLHLMPVFESPEGESDQQRLHPLIRARTVAKQASPACAGWLVAANS